MEAISWRIASSSRIYGSNRKVERKCRHILQASEVSSPQQQETTPFSRVYHSFLQQISLQEGKEKISPKNPPLKIIKKPLPHKTQSLSFTKTRTLPNPTPFQASHFLTPPTKQCQKTVKELPKTNTVLSVPCAKRETLSQEKPTKQQQNISEDELNSDYITTTHLIFSNEKLEKQKWRRPETDSRCTVSKKEAKTVGACVIYTHTHLRLRWLWVKRHNNHMKINAEIKERILDSTRRNTIMLFLWFARNPRKLKMKVEEIFASEQKWQVTKLWWWKRLHSEISVMWTVGKWARAQDKTTECAPTRGV